MHELWLWGLPLLGPPLFALRIWLAGRHARANGSQVGDRLQVSGTYPIAQGGTLDLGTLDARVLVLVFMSNRCPGVKAYDGRLRSLETRFARQGVRFLGINSVPEQLYPNEGLSGMQRAARERGLPFPYVKDADQSLLRSVGAACTPQVFVLDEKRGLRYRGRIDDSFISGKVRHHDLRDALADVLAHRPVARPETTPLGCAIDAAPRSPVGGLAPDAQAVAA